MTFPYLLVSDCSTEPPRDLVEDFIDPKFIESLKEHPTIDQKALLWSRLILASISLQLDPLGRYNIRFSEGETYAPHVEGTLYSYCNMERYGNQVAIVLSQLPIFVSIRKCDLEAEQIERIRRGFPSNFNVWIDRQKDHRQAFYKVWTGIAVTNKQQDPLLALSISDEDALSIAYPSIYLRHSLVFWQNDDWICAVCGMVIPPLLTEIRNAEKTAMVLRQSRSLPSYHSFKTAESAAF